MLMLHNLHLNFIQEKKLLSYTNRLLCSQIACHNDKKVPRFLIVFVGMQIWILEICLCQARKLQIKIYCQQTCVITLAGLLVSSFTFKSHSGCENISINIRGTVSIATLWLNADSHRRRDGTRQNCRVVGMNWT